MIRKPTPIDVTNAFKFANQQMTDALRARHAFIFHTVLEPNSILWVPPGFWVVEKPINSDVNFGIRTSAVCKATFIYVACHDGLSLFRFLCRRPAGRVSLEARFENISVGFCMNCLV